MSTNPDAPPYDADLMDAVTDLGGALRGLVDASVRTAAPAADLRAAAAAARGLTADLSAALRPDEQLPELDDLVGFRRVYSPVSGVGSALAAPVRFRTADGGIVAEAVFGKAHEGPPGFLHGGMTGLVMDEVLGVTAIHAGLWGMTVHLEMDYRGPVPLGVPVVLTGRVTESVGRRTTVVGTIALAERPDGALVEARGMFVTPRPEVTAAYFGEVTDASGRPTPPRRNDHTVADGAR